MKHIASIEDYSNALRNRFVHAFEAKTENKTYTRHALSVFEKYVPISGKHAVSMWAICAESYRARWANLSPFGLALMLRGMYGRQFDVSFTDIDRPTIDAEKATHGVSQYIASMMNRSEKDTLTFIEAARNAFPHCDPMRLAVHMAADIVDLYGIVSNEDIFFAMAPLGVWGEIRRYSFLADKLIIRFACQYMELRKYGHSHTDCARAMTHEREKDGCTYFMLRDMAGMMNVINVRKLGAIPDNERSEAQRLDAELIEDLRAIIYTQRVWLWSELKTEIVSYYRARKIQPPKIDALKFGIENTYAVKFSRSKKHKNRLVCKIIAE